MKGRRKNILGVVLTLISLPPLLALYETVSFQVRNRNNGSIVSSGEKREYLLYVPKSYDSTRPTPLVISLHGGAGWPVMQRDLSGWNRLAESHGFVVVYPAGLRLYGTGPRGWRVTRPGASPRDPRSTPRPARARRASSREAADRLRPRVRRPTPKSAACQSRSR